MTRFRALPLALLALLVAAPAWANHDCHPNTLTVTLFAGQTIDAGEVTAAVIDDELCVTYTANSDWEIEEIHLAIASSPGGLPQTGTGNPKPGRFPYKNRYNPSVSTASICIEFTPTTDPVYIAAHAVVSGTPGGSQSGGQETAWGDGLDFPGANWATYFAFQPITCSPHE